MAVRLKPRFLAALVGGEHVASVFNGARAQQCFPVALSRCFRKIRRYQKCICSGGCHQPVLFRKADIVADAHAEQAKRRVRKNNFISRADLA